MIQIDVFRLHNNATIPDYGTSLSSCFDLTFNPDPSDNVIRGYDRLNTEIQRYINESNEVIIRSGDRLLIPTGLIFKVHQNYTFETFSDISSEKEDLRQFSIRLHARSGLALKRGLVLANSEGIVDVDYQEQVFILLTNISDMSQAIKIGERLAQGEVVTNEKVKFIEVEERPTKHSERGGGFGSTGTI